MLLVTIALRVFFKTGSRKVAEISISSELDAYCGEDVISLISDSAKADTE